MEDLNAKMGYLRGLADGLEISDDTKEGKVIGKIINLLDDIVNSVEAIKDDYEELFSYVEAIDEDLTELENGFLKTTKTMMKMMTKTLKTTMTIMMKKMTMNMTLVLQLNVRNATRKWLSMKTFWKMKNRSKFSVPTAAA